jgi:uncharacterized membrane protein
MFGKTVFEFIVTFIVFLSLDSIYLTSMKSYFDNQIKTIQGQVIQMNILAALLCYISLTFGVYYFVIRQKKSLTDAFLLGLMVYTVYEFTNWALFMNWKPTTVIIDSLWGATLFTLTTLIVNYILSMIK